MTRVPPEDRLFYYTLLPSAYIIIGALALLVAVVAWESAPALGEYGPGLYARNAWSPSEEGPGDYGLAAAVYGTAVTSLLAVAVALPLSVALAIAVEELAPRALRAAAEYLVDLAAGLPTVVFGLWGLEVLAPLLRDHVMRPLWEGLGLLPPFSCEPLSAASLFTAGALLAVMVTPYMFALVREAYRMVPRDLREAAASVAAAWYQYVLLMLSMVRPAVAAAALLGLGRAAGETVAVSLVVGNAFNIGACLFQPGYTVSALIANQFGNAYFYPLMPNVLFAGGLVLLAAGLALNWAGLRLLDRVRLYAR